MNDISSVCCTPCHKNMGPFLLSDNQNRAKIIQCRNKKMKWTEMDQNGSEETKKK